MKKNKFFLLLLVSTLIVFVGYSQNVNYSIFGIETQNDNHVPLGLKPGDKAPDFIGYDQKGQMVDSKKLLEKGPIVLFFYRGKCCSICSRYLNSYQDSLHMITDQGFSLVAITPESIDNVEQTVKLHNLSFMVIYDCQEKIMKDFDVMFNVTKEYLDKVIKDTSVDIAKNNGREVAHLPVPATYIVNKYGIIVAVQFDPDFKNRASVKWIIQNMGKAL